MLDVIRSIYSVPVIDIDVKSSGKRTMYSELEVKQAVAMYKQVGTYREVEKRLGISRNTVRLWVKKYLHKCDGVVIKRPVKSIKRVNPRDRLLLIVDLIKLTPMSPLELSNKLSVTTNTIRKDILDLLLEGKIKDISINPNARMVVAV